MRNSTRAPLLMVLGTLLAALVFSVMPLPSQAEAWRPDWLALVFIYWCLAEPRRIGLGAAWLSGLMLDALQGALLGQHALALIVIAYFALRLHLRIRVFPLPQQTLTVAVMIGVYQFILLWIDGAAGAPLGGAERWAPVVATLLVWPPLALVLGFMRARARASL